MNIKALAVLDGTYSGEFYLLNAIHLVCVNFKGKYLGSLMCAKLRTYKFLLLLRLSGAYSIIQMVFVYKLILYLLFTSHGTIAYVKGLMSRLMS